MNEEWAFVHNKLQCHPLSPSSRPLHGSKYVLWVTMWKNSTHHQKKGTFILLPWCFRNYFSLHKEKSFSYRHSLNPQLLKFLLCGCVWNCDFFCLRLTDSPFKLMRLQNFFNFIFKSHFNFLLYKALIAFDVYWQKQTISISFNSFFIFSSFYFWLLWQPECGKK